MLSLHIPPVITSERQGDAQMFKDLINNKYLIIDGYISSSRRNFIAWLINNNIRSGITLLLTHPHEDHADGIREIIKSKTDGKYTFGIEKFYCQDPNFLRKGLRNNKGSSAVKNDISYLESIISEAKARGIEVVYVKNNQSLSVGDIKFNTYFEQPSYVDNDDTNGWTYLNDGSVCTYFPELRYFSGGDGPEKIYDMCKKYGLRPVFFHIPHHGNNCTQSQAIGLKQIGALYCWDNDPSTKITDFLMFGRRRCIEAGLKYFDCRSAINVLFYSGNAYIYHSGSLQNTYSCSYSGASRLKSVTVSAVENVFLRKYGSSDIRISNLIYKDGYHPKSVQDKVNEVINLAKKIINGKANELGKNQTRIDNIDKLLGKGYGRLVQDEINSLLNSKARRW